MDRRLSAKHFDRRAELGARRFGTIASVDRKPGDTVKVGTGPGEIPINVAMRLWMSAHLQYRKTWEKANAVPEGDPVVVKHVGGPMFEVSAWWHPEPISCHGNAKKLAAIQMLRETMPDERPDTMVAA